jgi:hypothetical protein
LALSLKPLPLYCLFDLLAAGLLQLFQAADAHQFHQPFIIDNPVPPLGMLDFHGDGASSAAICQ